MCRVRGEVEKLENITTQADKVTGKGDLLLSAILRSSQVNSHINTTPTFMRKLDHNTFNNPDSKTTCDVTNINSKKYPQNLEITHCDKGKENKAILSSNLPDHKTLDRRSSPLPEPKVLGKRSDSKCDPVCLWKPVDYGQSSLISNNPQEAKSITSGSTNNRLCSAEDMYRTKQCLKNDNVNKCQEEHNDVLAEGLKSLDLNKRLEVSF